MEPTRCSNGAGENVRAAGWAFAAALSLPACFFDSRWGESKRAQEAAAHRATPGALHATPPSQEAAPASVRVLKVRAYATPRHAAEVLDWPHRVSEAVDDANRILGPTLALRLELVGTEPWTPQGGDDDLGALLDELAAREVAPGTDRVVGLAGSVPRYELSFHQLGLANMRGKHLVVRAMNDAREYEVIQRLLSELDEQERLKLYRARRRHKTAAVLLHEIGHTLGAPHELDARTLMHASYDSKCEGYSPPAAQLMRIALAHEIDPKAEEGPAFAEALLAELERDAAVWVPAEREALIAKLEAAPATRQTKKPAAATEPAPPSAGAAELAPLRADDRTTFAQAVEHQQSGRTREAWDTAKPLFAAYPRVYAVQDLRCQLAMKLGGAWQAIQAECEPLMKLVPGATGPSQAP